MAMLIYRRDWIRCNSLPDIFEDGFGWLDPAAACRNTFVSRPQR
jgi:hypothetical protein